MAKGKALFDLIRYAERQGVSMSELARRSNAVRRAKARKQKRAESNQLRFEAIKSAGRDWWNN